MRTLPKFACGQGEKWPCESSASPRAIRLTRKSIHHARRDHLRRCRCQPAPLTTGLLNQTRSCDRITTFLFFYKISGSNSSVNRIGWVDRLLTHAPYKSKSADGGVPATIHRRAGALCVDIAPSPRCRAACSHVNFERVSAGPFPRNNQSLTNICKNSQNSNIRHHRRNRCVAHTTITSGSCRRCHLIGWK